jgi:hypothetical protein
VSVCLCVCLSAMLLRLTFMSAGEEPVKNRDTFHGELDKFLRLHAAGCNRDQVCKVRI